MRKIAVLLNADYDFCKLSVQVMILCSNIILNLSNKSKLCYKFKSPFFIFSLWNGKSIQILMFEIQLYPILKVPLESPSSQPNSYWLMNHSGVWEFGCVKCFVTHCKLSNELSPSSLHMEELQICFSLAQSSPWDFSMRQQLLTAPIIRLWVYCVTIPSVPTGCW